MDVKLIDGLGEPVEFTYRQAEDILRGQAKMKMTSWTLPDDSPYEFKDNGLILRPSKKHTERKAEAEVAGESKEARKSPKVSRRDDSE